MTRQILHILNGEGTAGSFRNSSLSGTAMVWNEALCEGPVTYRSSLDTMLATRLPFLLKNLQAEKHPHIERFRMEWIKWENLGNYSEVVLWFEYDLFCQANLLFICHHLYHHTPSDLTISLVSPSHHPEVSHFRGMGQLNAQQLEGLFPDRIVLSYSDLAYADKVWEAWAKGDLKSVFHLSKVAPPNWPHLQSAIRAMLEELPDVEDGLSATERLIVSHLESGPKKPGELFRYFLDQRDVLGFGDVQFFNVVDGLEPKMVQFKEGQYALRKYPEEKEETDLEERQPNSDSQQNDRWVASVKVSGHENCPKWDQTQQKIVYSA